MKAITKIFAGLISFITFQSIGQEQDYQVGFKVISTYDSSRTYKPSAIISDKLHFRPIDIDLWYPANLTSTDSTASFEDLVYLLEERSNFFDDTQTFEGLTEELLQYICAGLNCSDYNSLKRVKTKSYVNAKPIDKQFPLIIYFAGFNGMSYENYFLFELLTRKGFIVASVSSIGRYPGNMTMKQEDIFEQIKDAEFIIDYLTQNNVASQEIGLIGYSWGGLAATIMAMNESARIKGIVSLDGSEQFTYVNEEENEKLNRIREADFFTPEKINGSFLYLDSDISEWDNFPDSVYNINSYILGENYYLKIDNSTHEDFSSLSIVSSEKIDGSMHSIIQELTVNFMLDKLQGKDSFNKKIPKEGVTKQFSQPFLQVDLPSTDNKSLTGIIRDRKTNQPLPFVNVGIPNGNIGTASNNKGEFELHLLESNSKDTLRFSMIGYEPELIPLEYFFRKQNMEFNVSLEESTDELKEVVITGEKLHTHVFGNKTQSKFFGGKFASGDLGSEIAIRIKIKKAPTYLDTFSFNISYNESDTSAFRLNIYDLKNGLPNKNILTENIILKINGETGKIDVDLSKYSTIVNNDFFIGLEWIEGKNNSGIVFSSGFLNKGTYYRKASQGSWKKHPMGIGFSVTGKY